jgi:hypothetical protein
MRRAAKRDANEAEIITALRLHGVRVFQVSDGGFPDLACLWRGVWHLLEVKGRSGSLTPAQKAMVADVEAAGGKVHVVRTQEEALAIFEGKP